VCRANTCRVGVLQAFNLAFKRHLNCMALERLSNMVMQRRKWTSQNRKNGNGTFETYLGTAEVDFDCAIGYLLKAVESFRFWSPLKELLAILALSRPGPCVVTFVESCKSTQFITHALSSHRLSMGQPFSRSPNARNAVRRPSSNGRCRSCKDPQHPDQGSLPESW
jgi:hypothetical protein